MPALIELKEEMRKASLQALEIIKDDKLTQAEKKEAVDKAEAEIKAFSEKIAEVEKAVAEQKYLEDQRKRFEGLAEVHEVTADEKGVHVEPDYTTKSFGQQLVESDAFKSKMDDSNRSSIFSTGNVELKATLTSTTAGGITGGGAAQPDFRPGILPMLFQRLTVADLMPSGQTGSALVRYLKETVATNAAAAVAEGAAKPESTLNFAAVDEAVKKIATTLKVTDELFSDAPALRSYVDGRLSLFVEMAEEAQLLTGSGVGANITGILNRAGLTAAQAKGADTEIDAIYKDITKIRVASFLEPDAIVMHPNDWQAIRLSKDANNQYYGGGPFTGAYGAGGMAGDMLWGLRVVVTTAMTENTALVGAFRTAAQVFRRGGITVEATNSNEDDFKNNLIALRAEERLALAVYRPAAFSTVTGI